MMLQSVLQYLVESTLYLISFLIIYRLVLSKLTHFNWMRVFLLGGLMLGLILPLITLPVNWHYILPGASSIEKPLSLTFPNLDSTLSQQNQGTLAPEKSPILFWGILGYGIITAYFFVLSYKLFQLGKKLLSIRSSIRNNPGEQKGRYCFIQLEMTSPAFSFFNFIFLSKNLSSLSSEETERITKHEIIHARQYHTLDILFLELLSVLFWFNPLIKIFKESLQEVHEYLADEHILKNLTMKQSYSNLLLKLATDEHHPIPSSAFSAKQISSRLRMIEKSRSLPYHRILFFLLLPIATFLLMSFSYLENRSNPEITPIEQESVKATSAGELKVGAISWTGNTLYTDSQLNERLGIKQGDVYNADLLNKRLWGLDSTYSEEALSSLYLDNGYLFFNIEFKEGPKENGYIDLTFNIFEGIQAYINEITIEGSGIVPERKILKRITIKKGDLFSKAKLINSVGAIAEMRQFDPDKIEITPTPVRNPASGDYTLVDIEFKLTENQ